MSLIVSPDSNISDFDAVRLTVASPEDILKWSYGEVTKPETINYRTQKPERDGLFCERIFGPVKDINPHDTKLRGIRSREAAVDKNGELVTKSSVRRERMGHIKLATPVAHIWFLRGVPSAMSLLLGITVRNLERITYFASYVILDVDTEKRDQYLTDLDAQNEAGKLAIKIRYDKMSEADGADIKALAKDRTKELEELNNKYITNKAQLESLTKWALINEADYHDLPDEYSDLIDVNMGGNALEDMLKSIDLDKLIEDLTKESDEAKGQKKKRILKRLKVLESMQSAGIKPTSLIITVLPVIPPDLRPMVQLTGGRFATSDMNDLYRRVINRNNRLKKLISLNAPEVICRNEMRMLQEAVDAVVDNNASRNGKAVSSNGGRHLKSLSDMLKGKQGRFRQNLLGKRVDYSGRSVIAVGPNLKINQCGLPKEMAVELFKPFIISWLIRHDYAHNIRTATHLIESGEAVVWDALDEVIKDKYVLLNRAPSLHRLSIQAFQPVLVDTKAIRLHPLVANGFNADYDGDQMAVHLPLSKEAQDEAHTLMSSVNNLLKPADGSPVLSIVQDVVLGNYYLTYNKRTAQTDEVKSFSSIYEAEMAYDKHVIQLQTPIRLFVKGKMQNTTFGRVLFNEILPVDLPYDNNIQTKKQLKKVLAKIFDKYGSEVTAETADKMKALAFQYATVAAVSTSMGDYMLKFDDIPEFIAEGDAKAKLISNQYDQGLIAEDERYSLTVANWRGVDSKISDYLAEKLDSMDTSISVMVNSGARGDISNIKLASAMIGVQVDATNREIELPIRSSYINGLSSLESFVATRGSRKGLIDTALKTADSGYLTRRLVDVSQDVFTTEQESVEEDDGFTIYRSETNDTMIDFSKRLYGRYTAEEVPGYVGKDELITKEIADAIEEDDDIKSVKIQSVLSTSCLRGIPRRSYGIDMATGKLVEADQPVGVIAAQSVGEPGTQLTLNTFHSSGVGGSDITQGLPRVEELFEARNPKGQAFISEISGTVDIWENGKNYVIQIAPESGKVKRYPFSDQQTIVIKSGSSVKKGDLLAKTDDQSKSIVAPFDGVVEVADDSIVIVAKANAPVRYEVPGTYQLSVKAGDFVEPGDRLTSGSLNLQDLMRLKGIEATERYIINEILRIYAAQGQDVADKHLEIIVRQMFSRVQIEDSGDSEFVTGDIVSKAAVAEKNQELAKSGKKLIQYNQLLLGITKVSIWSDSWLSAASFQDTTRVLINAAISGKVDHLHGLKENVIIGRKIPVGTGARRLTNNQNSVDNETEANSDDSLENQIAKDVETLA